MIKKINLFLKPFENLGVIGGIILGIISLSIVFQGALFNIKQLAYVGIGLYGLLIPWCIKFIRSN